MRTIGRRQQQQLDASIGQNFGIPVRVLMEYAGMAVAREAKRMLSEGMGCQPVRILCGHGQNGGDALVAARLLHADGYAVRCHLDGFPAGTPEFADQLSTVRALGIACENTWTLDTEPGLIIDGIYGTGFQADRPLPKSVAIFLSQIREARNSGARVLAIDVPSGLETDTARYADLAVQADRTVTFLFPKTGLVSDPGRDLAGEIIVDRLGLSEEALIRLLDAVEPPTLHSEWIDDPMIRRLAPVRPRRMHKGQGGRALLIAGSPGYGGAALLAGEAALRSGAGLVNLLTDDSQISTALCRIPEAMVTGLHGSEDAEAVRKLDHLISLHPAAMGIGPGIGLTRQSASLLAAVLEKARSIVVDADALSLIAADPDRFRSLLRARLTDPDKQPAVLTPHPGEFARLMPEAQALPRHEAGRRLAERTGSVVVLKGAATVVAAPDGRICINSTGNSGLARGGSGDVLTGLLTGILAQGLPAFDAALCAVYLHGLAADLAASEDTKRTILASDVIARFPAAFRASGWQGDPEVPGRPVPDPKYVQP